MVIKMKNKVSFIVSLGGSVSALCLFSMFMTGIMPMFVYTFPALAGALLIIIVIELGIKWAFLTYSTVGLLSLFITPDKEAAVMFIMFLGYYPIVKSFFEKTRIRALEWLLKLACFSVSVILAYQIIIKIFGITDVLSEFGEFGKYGALAFLAAANVVFVIYDIALTRIISAYISWFRPKILRKLK